MRKKGALQNLVPVVVSLVAVGIVLAVGFLILASIGSNSSVTADTNASAAVNATQSAMDDIPGWLPIIVITIIGALLLGLVRYFRS